MERIQRPTPLRPQANNHLAAQDPLQDTDTDPGSAGSRASHASHNRLRPSRSVADLNSLSRTASFLSFSGIAEKSSALFGIFERGGYASPDDPAAAATVPGTPDLSPRLPDGGFQLGEAHRKLQAVQRKPVWRPALIKCACVFLAAYLFISLFNKLPKNNPFCKAITTHEVPRIPYALAATFISLLVPFLDATLSHAAEPFPSQSKSPMRKDKRPMQFSLIVRYFAGFLGVAYAGTKLDYNDAATFNTCCVAILLGYIFWIDGTVQGFAILTTLTFFGTAAWATALAVLAAGGAQVLPYQTSAEVLSAGALIGLNLSVWGLMGKLWQRAT